MGREAQKQRFHGIAQSINVRYTLESLHPAVTSLRFDAPHQLIHLDCVAGQINFELAGGLRLNAHPPF